MSIDGIGKRGGVAPGAPAPGGAPVQGPFELGQSVAPSATPAAAASADAFAALSRGEINVDQYLDAKVESAVAPLLSRLSPEQLEFVRNELRAALETDPVLVELVRKSTGASTSSP